MFRTFNHCIILWHNEHKEKGDLGDRKTELSRDSKNFFSRFKSLDITNLKENLSFIFILCFLLYFFAFSSLYTF